MRTYVPPDSAPPIHDATGDPTQAIAKAARYPIPPKPAPDYRHLSVNTRKLLAKRPADLSPFLKSLPCAADAKILLDIQRRSDALIAAISSNTMAEIAKAYERDVAALKSWEKNRINSDPWLSLEERQASARDRNKILDAELQLIISSETKPACLRVLREARELARAQFIHVQETERDLWQKYGVAHEESELFRAVRDTVDTLVQAVENHLSGFTGDVTPRGLLANFGIQL